MNKQISLADMEYSNRKRQTKREAFLDTMEELIPWQQWMNMVKPHYSSGKRGRPPRELESMLRMYLLTNWFNLSDEGVEDAIYDSYAFRKFMKVDFQGDEQVPDATTLCRFRKLLNETGLTKQFFESISAYLDEQGKLMHGGTIVDATIIEAPSSTKNAEKKRDPEMHSTRKNNQYYFGEKLHIGVDAGTGYIHHVETTAANVADIVMASGLIREDDEVLYGDAGYIGIEKRAEVVGDAHLSQMEYRINQKKKWTREQWKPGPGQDWFDHIERGKSRVRWQVEYAFFVIKRLFGYRKVRYRGLQKNRTQAYMLCTCTNLFMLAQSQSC